MLLEAVSDYAVYMLTPEGIVASWNKGAERNKGYSAAEAIGLHISSFYTPEDCASDQPAKTLEAARSSKFETYGWRVRKDGSRFWAHVVLEAIRNLDGTLIGYAKVTCDVTAQKLERDQLVRNLDAALSNMSQALCLFDAEERLVLVNARLWDICGLSKGDVEPGTLFIDVIRAILIRRHPNEPIRAMAADWYERHRRLIQQQGGGSLILTLLPDRVLSVVHRPMHDGSWVTTFEDISERSRSEGQIAHMAMHDGLTDLPNRTMLRGRLDEALQRVGRGETCAVLCLDLDRFKTVNDTLGHPIGDALLVSIGNKLRELVRDADTVGRLGGDEFVIVQCNLKHPNDATALAERVLRELSKPHDLEGHRVVSGISIGIALAPADGLDAEHLLKCADLALYRAKTEGRGRYCYFEPEMDAALQKRRLLEFELRTALASDEFELYYQPIVDMERDEVCGFEALLRWQSPKRGMVALAEFIHIAEEIGLIVDIGTWALQRACREAMTWPANIKVAVNVSAAQFKGFGLVEAVSYGAQPVGPAASAARDRNYRIDHDQ